MTTSTALNICCTYMVPLAKVADFISSASLLDLLCSPEGELAGEDPGAVAIFKVEAHNYGLNIDGLSVC